MLRARAAKRAHSSVINSSQLKKGDYFECVAGDIIPADGEGRQAVSYTHLDVYKRQVVLLLFQYLLLFCFLINIIRNLLF